MSNFAVFRDITKKVAGTTRYILRGIFRVVSRFPLDFVLYLGIGITFWTVWVTKYTQLAH